MSMEFYEARDVKARKQHRCHLCGDNIPIGTSYIRECGKYDGDFFDRCTCKDCYGHIEEYCTEVEPEYTDWAIEEYLKEEYCEKLCTYDEQEDCMENLWHCSKLIETQIAKEGK